MFNVKYIFHNDEPKENYHPNLQCFNLFQLFVVMLQPRNFNFIKALLNLRVH